MFTEKQLQERLRALGEVECGRDHHQFKLKLGLGEEAYASLHYYHHLQELWDVGGAAAAGAGLRKPYWPHRGRWRRLVWHLDASGLVVWCGLGIQHTYYGVMRMIKDLAQSRGRDTQIY